MDIVDTFGYQTTVLRRQLNIVREIRRDARDRSHSCTKGILDVGILLTTKCLYYQSSINLDQQ